MSMISSLIDELRKSADEWNGSNMFELARMCSDAADIIWELRDDLQRANAENSKLRELVRDMYQCSRQVGCDHCGDGYRRNCGVLDSMRELGIEVEA